MPYDPDLPMPQDEFRRFLEEMTLLKRMPKLAEVCECGSLLRLGSRCRGDRNNRQPHLRHVRGLARRKQSKSS
jgi:hypothetical protein